MRAFINRRVTGAALPTMNVGVLVSWCGMRGLVTLATAFALPAAFPGRNGIVLSAFTVVLGHWFYRGSPDAYHLLEDELDRSELHAASLGSTSLDG